MTGLEDVLGGGGRRCVNARKKASVTPINCGHGGEGAERRGWWGGGGVGESGRDGGANFR